MERTGQCHCGSLRVIATGEPDRVYVCHCKACQSRTGTAFHFGATFPKERARLCHGNEQRIERRQGLIRSHIAATASNHCAAASALKIRSVDREMRWR